MTEALLGAVFDQPFVKVLGLAGIVFLLVAVGLRISGRIEPGTSGRILAGVVGGVFVLIALAQQFVPQPPQTGLPVVVAGATAQPVPPAVPTPTTAPPVGPTSTASKQVDPTPAPAKPVAPTPTAPPAAPPALSTSPLADLRDHAGPVRALAFNPNGSQLLSASEDTRSLVWDIASGKSTQKFENAGPADAAAWSPGAFADLVATAAARTTLAPQTIRVWSITDGRETIQGTSQLTGHTGRIRSIAWAPEGKVLASAADDATVRIWAPGDPAPELGSWPTGHGAAQVVAWIGNEDKPKRIVAGANDGTVIMWNVAWSATSPPYRLMGDPVVSRTLLGRAPARALAYSPQTGMLGFVSSQARVSLIDLNVPNSREREATSPSSGNVGVLAFAADGSRLASGSDHGVVAIWATRDGTLQHVGDLSDSASEVTALAWWGHAPTERLAIGRQDGSVKVVQVAR